MKLSELLQKLVEIAEALNPDHDDIIGSELDVDPEIRIAIQPSWPMEYHVSHLKLFHTNAEDIAELEDILSMTRTERSITEDTERAEAQIELDTLRAQDKAIIYIVEGAHIGYASKDLWDQED
jgi:hypothetical protein